MTVAFLSTIFVLAACCHSHEVSIQTNHTEDLPNDTAPGMPVFKATREWQELLPDQAVPEGLHIRLNLQTGKREAKLLDTASDSINENTKLTVSTSAKPDTPTPKQSILTREEIAKALHRIKPDLDTATTDQPSEESVKSRFRSYDELKKDFEQLNLAVKTDIEIIHELWAEYNKSEVTNERKQTILEDLTYLLHQIDNAQNFADEGGIDFLMKEWFSPCPGVRQAAVSALASSLQSNTKVQIRALESGFLSRWLTSLHNESNPEALVRSIFALGAQLRHFPHAQWRFFHSGAGGEVGLTRLFTRGQQEAPFKARLRVLTLLGDLYSERVQHEDHANPEDKMYLEKQKQYNEVGLSTILVQKGWCPRIVDTLTEAGDQDSREKLLRTMLDLGTLCGPQWRALPATVDRLTVLLDNLTAEYTSLAKGEANSTDEYYEEMIQLVRRARELMWPVKDEL